MAATSDKATVQRVREPEPAPDRDREPIDDELVRSSATALGMLRIGAPPDDPRATVGSTPRPADHAVVHLQRTAGNRAVAQAIQREGSDQEYSGGPVPAGMIQGAEDCKPSMSGEASASPAGELVNVFGPTANLPEKTLSLASGWKIADGTVLKIGYIQNVASAVRIGVYEEEAATPGGSPRRFEQHQTTMGGPTLDVALGQYARGETPFKRAQPPFYLPPATMTSSYHQGVPLVAAADPSNPGSLDRPKFGLFSRIGKARLVAVRGADSFTMSLGAVAGGATTHLSTATWSVDWTMDIGPDLIGKGKSGTSSAGGNAPTVLEPPYAKDTATDYLNVPTIDAAMAIDVPTLVGNLLPAKAAGDLVSYNSCVGALHRKNPMLSVAVVCHKTDAFIGRDHVRLQLAAEPDKAVDTKLNDGQEALAFTTLNAVVGSQPIERAGIQATVTIADEHTTTLTFPFPFLRRSRPVATEDGWYELRNNGI